jgi:hypothetical protein
MYQVEVFYPAKYYPEMDDQLTEILGYSDCSGMGFGERDHSWYFKTKKAAKAAYDKVKRIKKVKVHLDVVED